MQQTYAQDEAHQESTNVTEVVETREQAQDERNDDVDQDEHEVLDGGRTFAPSVQELKQGQGQDAEQRTRAAGTRDAGSGKVAAEDETKDAAAEVDE